MSEIDLTAKEVKAPEAQGDFPQSGELPPAAKAPEAPAAKPSADAAIEAALAVLRAVGSPKALAAVAALENVDRKSVAALCIGCSGSGRISHHRSSEICSDCSGSGAEKDTHRHKEALAKQREKAKAAKA